MQTYIHGDSSGEQQRLIRQARVLAPFILGRVDLGGCRRVLDLGCGVGAQLHILADRYPAARFDGVEASARQIERAASILKAPIRQGRVALHRAEAGSLPFADASFDAVVIVFVLEHLPDPWSAISEVHRLLRPGGVVHCIEVVNGQVVAFPPSAALASYWDQFNHYQRQIGGDPDIGIRLGGLFHQAGFREATLHDTSVVLDARTQDATMRKDIVDNWVACFLSAADALIEREMVEPSCTEIVRSAFLRYLEDEQSVFVYPSKHLRARR